MQSMQRLQGIFSAVINMESGISATIDACSRELPCCSSCTVLYSAIQLVMRSMIR